MAKGLALTGDKELDTALKKLEGKESIKAVKKAARIVIKPMLAQAKAKVPVDTGNLKKFLRLKTFSEGFSGRKWTGVKVYSPERFKLQIHPDAPGYYPASLEFGTKKMKAFPFLRPAYDAFPNAPKQLREEFLKQIEIIWLA